MRALEAAQATWHRMQRPATWGAVLLFGLAWSLARWSLGGAFRSPLDLASPFLWVLLFLTVTPVPWQWSGTGSLQVRPWRGLLQALPWNAAWMALLLLGLGGAFRDRPVPGRGPGPMGRGFRGVPPSGRPRLPLPPRLLLMGLTGLSAALLTGWILSEKERAEAVELEARRTATEAQVRALQAQMNPHVLFNAISGLTELVREDPEAAEEALVNLADLLRALLDHGARALAPLAEERALVERTLGLEAIRLGRRLTVEWRWDAGLEALEVPPLLLQPLVENALKHGIAPSRAGGTVRISLRADGARLELEVANTGLPLREDSAEGVGLRNLRDRLALMGLPPSALGLERKEGWTCVTIRLPRPGGTP